MFSTYEPVGMIIAPTHPILDRATAPTFADALKGTTVEGRYVPSQNRYYLPHGGVIWLVSADRPNSIEGGQIYFAWLDEAGQMRYSAWIAALGRLGQKQGRGLITTTPYAGFRWIDEHFIKFALEGDKDYFFRRWSSNANPAYPDEEYERAKRTMAPWRFRMRYDGEFTQPEGLVYPQLASCVVDAVRPPAGALYGGIDFGYANDPFAALAATQYVTEDGQDILYLWYERYKSGTFIEQHAQALPAGVTWFADPSEPEAIAKLRRAGHAVRKAAIKRIPIGVDMVTERLYDGGLKISKACRALIAESKLYTYPAEEDIIMGDIPIDANNHACDALRYLVGGVDRHRAAAAAGG